MDVFIAFLITFVFWASCATLAWLAIHQVRKIMKKRRRNGAHRVSKNKPTGTHRGNNS